MFTATILASIFQYMTLVTFLVVTGLGTFRYVSWLCHSQKYAAYWFAISIGLGPILASYVTTIALRLVPGLPSYAYLGLILILFGIPALLDLPRVLRLLGGGIISYFKSMDSPLVQLVPMIFLSGIVIWLIGALVQVNVFLPITGNDPLLYFTGAKQIAMSRSMAEYPFVAAGGDGGFYGGWTHGAGFTNLLVLGYWIQGSFDTVNVVRLITPYLALAIALLVWVFAARGKPLAGPIAATLLLATPLFFQTIAQSHVDPLRVLVFAASAFSLFLLIKSPKFSTAIMVGIIAGMAQFCHSLGLLILPILLPLYIIVSGRPLREVALHTCTVAIIAMAIMAPTMINNYEIYGSVISDQTLAGSFAHIETDKYIGIARNLVTPVDKLWFGILVGFSEHSSYHNFYWLFIVMLGVYAVANWRNLSPVKIWTTRSFIRPDLTNMLLWVCGGYFGIVTITTLLGDLSLIKNSRYSLSILPFICVISARIIADIVSYLANTDDMTNLVKKIVQSAVPGAAFFKPIGAIFIRWSRQFQLLISLVLVYLICSASYGVSKTSVSWATSQANSLRLTRYTLNDTDHEKIYSGSWVVYQLIRKINEDFPADTNILAFRPGDFALYLNKNFFDYQDPSIAPLYLVKTKQAAIDFLKSKKITHVYIPSYALPEIYNTIVSELIGDPAYTRLEYNSGNYWLYTVLPKPEVPKLRLLYDVDFKQQPDAMSGWNATSNLAISTTTDESIDSQLKTQLGISTISGNEIRLVSPWLSDKNFDLAGGESGTISGKVFHFEATVEGDGLLEVYFTLSHLENGRRRNYQSNVWTGILEGKRQKISSQFFVQVPTFVDDPLVEVEQEFNLRLHMRNGSKISLDRWSLAAQVDDGDIAEVKETSEKQEFFSSGWSITGQYGSLKVADFGKRSDAEGNTVHFDQNSGHPIEIVSPYFSRKKFWSSNDHKVPTPDVARSAIAITASLSGSGSTDLKLHLFCDDSPEPKILELGRTGLSTYPVELRWNTIVPCLPTRTKIEFLFPNLANPARLYSPKSNIAIKNMAMAVKYLDYAGRVIKEDLIKSAQ